MQDNTGDLTISSTLTRLGRKRLSQGNFKITKFAVADDGVNYNLYSTNLPEPDIYITRSPIFSLWKDGASSVQSKIPIQAIDAQYVNYKYKLNVVKPATSVSTQSTDENTADSNPRYIDTGVNKNIVYNFVTNPQTKTEISTEMSMVFQNLPFPNGAGNSYISITLHDNKYFDIGVTPVYLRNLQDNFVSQGIYSDFTKRNDMNQILVSKSSSSNSLPKTINLGYTDILDINFVLLYKGNYPFKNVGVNSYDTVLSILCEETGLTEDIRLTIKLSTSL